MHEKYSHKILTTTEFIQIQIFLFFFFWRNRVSNRTTVQQNISNPTYFRIHLLILFRARERSIPPLKNFKRDQISIRFKFFSESNFELTVRESNKFPFQDSDFSSKIRKSGTSDRYCAVRGRPTTWNRAGQESCCKRCKFVRYARSRFDQSPIGR